MKPYQVKRKFNGTLFTAQFNGLSAALKMQDSINMDGTGVTSNEKLAAYIFENVIVDPPHLTADDDVFPDMKTLNEVVTWGLGVANGKFRGESGDADAEKQDK